MKAYTIHEAGGVENLRVEELPAPLVGEEDVLIQVKAIGINPIDVKTRSGKGLFNLLKNESPLILGWDVAGVIVETGKRVTRVRKGDEVFGMINFPGHGKAYAEYVAAPASHLAVKPANISFPEAAASSLAALTAWQALHAFSPVQKGQRVLVHAAAGGVGHFAVQMAKTMGAWVAGTSSSKNKDFILSLGADVHIDYEAAPLRTQTRDVDFVLDTIGGSTIDSSLEVMKKGAVIVSIPSGSNEMVAEKAKAAGMQGHTFKVSSNGSDMRSIADLLTKGALKPHVSHIFSFQEMRDAHDRMETGRTRGKLIVSVP